MKKGARLEKFLKFLHAVSESKETQFVVLLLVAIPCVIIGFAAGGVGGAIVGALVGAFLGAFAAYYLPVAIAAMAGFAVIGLAAMALILVIFLIYSLWGVGQPA